MLYQNAHIYIERHESEIPWLKIFTHGAQREFSECSDQEKAAVWHALDVIEKCMLEYYKPTKINIASFGNMLPRVHWHIMARFETDSYFPEPMWGPRQREAELRLPDFDKFVALVCGKLDTSA